MNIAVPRSVFAQSGFAFLPFRFARIPGVLDRVLLTSEAGEFHFVTEAEFAGLVAGTLDLGAPVIDDLEAKHIVYRDNADLAVRLLATKLRTKKSFLRGGPALHIFVVTLRCDHSCHYCQVSRHGGADGRFDLSASDAEHAVKRMFDSPSLELTVEFQGGEPTLAFERIRQIVDLVERRNVTEHRSITFTMTSTLQHLDDEKLAFLREHRFHLSTSLDGDASLPTPTARRRPARGMPTLCEGWRGRAALWDTMPFRR